MRFKPNDCKHLQGAVPVKEASHFTGQADARPRVRRRPLVFQVPDDKADGVPVNADGFLFWVHESGLA